MASVRSSLRAYAQDVYDLDEIMSRVNIALSRDTRSDEFATLFYGVLDPATRRMTYCSAGHEPPLLLRDGKFTKLDVGGTVVGIDPEQVYEKGVVQLQDGDFLLFYTDGLTDAQNFNNERFGRTRILKAMRDMEKAPAQDAVNHMLWEMRRYIGLKPAIDDTTIVVVKVGAKK
jgi:serine phosphatase RsbU (regulator of sigma subunit)